MTYSSVWCKRLRWRWEVSHLCCHPDIFRWGSSLSRATDGYAARGHWSAGDGRGGDPADSETDEGAGHASNGKKSRGARSRQGSFLVNVRRPFAGFWPLEGWSRRGRMRGETGGLYLSSDGLWGRWSRVVEGKKRRREWERKKVCGGSLRERETGEEGIGRGGHREWGRGRNRGLAISSHWPSSFGWWLARPGSLLEDSGLLGRISPG